MGSRVIDETGNVYGRLTVLHRSGSRNGKAELLCRCECGNLHKVCGKELRIGNTKSCGCAQYLRPIPPNTKHGECPREGATPRYRIWSASKHRARHNDIEFDLELEDVEIPSHCPALGVQMEHGGKYSPNHPSIDRIDPNKGYTKDNIAVISRRANTIKSNATPEELLKIAGYAMQAPNHLLGWADYQQELE